MVKHGPTSEASRRHQTIQRERALYIKALVAEGKTDDEIVKILLVDDELARSFISYAKNY